MNDVYRNAELRLECLRLAVSTYRPQRAEQLADLGGGGTPDQITEAARAFAEFVLGVDSVTFQF